MSSAGTALAGRIVIAGGSGFLGTSLARHLDNLGAETIVIARLPGVEKLVFARLAGEATMRIGERRQLFLDAGKAHVFDGNGLALRPA